MSRKQEFDQYDDLIDELQRNGERSYAPRAFKKELRSQLLNQYDQPRFSLANLGRLAGTAVAFAALALVVWFGWVSLRQQPAAISAQMSSVDVPGRDEFIVYDQLRIELPMWVEYDAGWAELTAESWQSLDGTFFRGEVVDANGKHRVFTQGDSQFLWRGTYNSRVARMETVSLQYFDVYHALAQAEGWAGAATTPPFYNDVGWGGLIASVLRLDWNCEGGECINKYLVEPPLDVNSRGGEYEPYGWGVSLIGTETTANGRSLTTYRISYSPNQDGNASSQYRLVKLDSNNHTVVEVADYDGDTLLRRLERVSHQISTSADLPEDQFTHLPANTGVSFVLPESRVLAETPLLTAPNGEQEAMLEAGTQLTLSGLINSQPTIIRDGATWQYVSVRDVGQGWVNTAHLEWPLTSEGQLVDLDTSRLPTAVPTETQLIILRNYQTELQTLLPQTSGDDLPLLQQALAEIEAEIDRLEYLDSFDSLGQDGIDVVSWGLDQLTLDFDGELTLTAFNIEEGPNELNLMLDWRVQERPSANYQLFFHLRDGQGDVVAQVDQTLQDGERFPTAWNVGEQIRTTLTLTLPDDLFANRYDLIVGLFDMGNGTRLPVTVDNPRQSTDGGTAVWLTDWFVEHKESHPIAIVRGTDSNGLALRSEPTGQEIGILEEGTPVILIDDPLLLEIESDGLFWQSVSTPIGKGWVVSNFLEYPEGYTLADTMPWSPDSLWIVKATQLSRSNSDEAITLEVTVGYELVTADEASLSLSFIHPSGMPSLDGIRNPNYNALGNGYAIQSGTGSVTFTATVESEAITSAIGSNEFELMARLWATDGNGQQTSDLILMGFDKGATFDVQFVEEINYQMESPELDATAPDSLNILNVSPPIGSVLNGRTTFTVTVAYQLTSLDTAHLNSSLLPAFGGAAVLVNDQQIIERGDGELTYSFVFEPLETDEPSAWILDIRLEDPLARPAEASLATASPHSNYPSDVYNFEP
ncbi:hypothetical protein [Candidatus Leptofilum sp.]|uniref:hypothetical protein n=1 Tax=Candidatus Leptofilum sp. TaxID=3241576 RepID=UPI003B5CC4F6